MASLFPFPKGPSSGRAEQHVGRRVDCRSDLASSQSPRSESCVVRPAGDRPKRRSSCTSSSRVSSVWAAFVPVGSTLGRAKARLSRLPCALSAPVAFAWQASTGGGRSSYRCVLRKESGRSPPIRRGLVGAAFSQPDPWLRYNPLCVRSCLGRSRGVHRHGPPAVGSPTTYKPRAPLAPRSASAEGRRYARTTCPAGRCVFEKVLSRGHRRDCWYTPGREEGPDRGWPV